MLETACSTEVFAYKQRITVLRLRRSYSEVINSLYRQVKIHAYLSGYLQIADEESLNVPVRVEGILSNITYCVNTKGLSDFKYFKTKLNGAQQ
jgi:hypothetical protein